MLSYCSNCGKELQPGAAYCSGCGYKVPVSTNATNDQLKQKGVSLFQLKTWHIVLLLAVLATAAGWFIFSIKEQTPDNSPIASEIPTEQTSLPTAGNTPAPSPAGLSTAERERVINVVTGFYEAENNENVAALLSYYSFPVERYYQLYSVGYEQMHKMVVDALNGKLYYHNIDIKWEYSTVSKLASGMYKLLLYADYTSASEELSDKTIRRLHLVLLLNPDMKITAIYPV